MIKFISYHNRHPLYQACSRQLEGSLESAGICEYFIEEVNNDTWDFIEACAFKPKFIRKCMDLFPQAEALTYLDSDSIVEQFPQLLYDMPNWVDLAVHYKGGKELLASVIWVRNSERMKHFIGDWAKVMATSREWDQRELQKLVDGSHIGLFTLPPEYCQIFDTMAGLGGEPVIRQMQASRKSRGVNPDHNPIVKAAA